MTEQKYFPSLVWCGISSKQHDGMGWGWYALPFIVTAATVFLSPYTKVEETPALHAVHDLLEYGGGEANLGMFDHVVYLGPVARSMVPSVILAGIVSPIVALLDVTDGLGLQILGITLSLIHSTTTGKAFLALSLSQFHVPYYAGRTLPNLMALPFVMHGISTILRAEVQGPRGTLRRKWALGLVAWTATVMRMEIAPLAAGIAMALVWYKQLSLKQALFSGAAGGLSGLALTSTLDAHFLAPISHTYPHACKDWGVMPWWYYLAALCKLGLGSVPLAILGVWAASKHGKEDEWRVVGLVLGLVLGCMTMLVGTLSFVGHKSEQEWRLIVYAVPLLNVLGTLGASYLWSLSVEDTVLAKHVPPRLGRLLAKGAVVSLLLGNILVTGVMTAISCLNYSGGQVGEMLIAMAERNGRVGKVWFPAAALHTGATLYTLPTATTHPHLSFTIDHPESGYQRCTFPYGNSPKELWDAGYDWVVTDDWDLFVREGVREDGLGWEVVDEVGGYLGLGKQGLRTGRRLALLGRTSVYNTD
ncbi:hypothetical protein IAT38_002471 [Cryptococcus sp. DSM 104549]